MAENVYKDLNVMQKLSKARLQFLNQKVSKTGKNMQLEFKYFELDDIVPTAIRIFARMNLTTNMTIYADKATMTVYNADNPEEKGLEFTAPFIMLDPIISNAGKQVTNQMQALGSSITYLRRYLWMMVLDITEPDSIDSVLGEEKPEIQSPAAEPEKKEKKKSSKPATKQERAEAKKELTATDGQADELQIKALKEVCKQLMDIDPDNEEFVQTIALKTNGMTNITRAACEELIKNISGMIENYGVTV